MPALLLHPRLTENERGRLLAIAARIGPIPHEDAAAVLFTSGTTGEPRGAVLPRAAFVASASASAANLGWNDDDCWLACMTIAHVGGLSILTRCLAARRAVTLAERFDAALFPRWIAEHRATLASVVPTMLARVLDAHPLWTPPERLRALLVGGASMSAQLRARAVERRLPIVTTYGSTETCSQVVATRYAERYGDGHGASGVPLTGVDLKIVDDRIHVRGDMLFDGYWDETPRAPGSWFDTGDAGAIDARGCVHVLGRGFDVIVTGGENVYPAEIERALEAMPGIAAAAVFGVTDETWGQIVVAALVARGSPPDDDALIAHVEGGLAPHKRPRRIVFVAELPHTRGGKLDRPALEVLVASLRPLRARR